MGNLTKAQQADRDEARAKLREIFPVGSTAHTILRHVSRSGMLRSISVIDPATCNDVTWLVSRALGWSRNKRTDGINVPGCGMDMGFHLIHSLSYAIHGYDRTEVERPGYTISHQ